MTAATDGQALHDAWEAMRSRANLRHWPQDFDKVMADPVRRRLVQLEATGRASTKNHPQHPKPVQALPTWHRTAGRQPTVQPARFDRKRAAAGDRDV
ncbi:MAG: hypothetical protein K2X51_12630 [Burkholderiales bacterium]|nr:hypothetical protein [Burkholderiales bacterium]